MAVDEPAQLQPKDAFLVMPESLALYQGLAVVKTHLPLAGLHRFFDVLDAPTCVAAVGGDLGQIGLGTKPVAGFLREIAIGSAVPKLEFGFGLLASTGLGLCQLKLHSACTALCAAAADAPERGVAEGESTGGGHGVHSNPAATSATAAE